MRSNRFDRLILPEILGLPFLLSSRGLLISGARHIQRRQCLPGMSAIHCRLQEAKSRSRILSSGFALPGIMFMFDSPTSMTRRRIPGSASGEELTGKWILRWPRSGRLEPEMNKPFRTSWRITTRKAFADLESGSKAQAG